MDHPLAVSMQHLTKTFGTKEVIRDCSFSVKQGTIYSLVGKNGAGKTTIFKLLLGLQKPTMGKSTIFGLNSTTNSPEILRITGSLIETPIFYEYLSASDNLKIYLDYMDVKNADIEETLYMVGLPPAGTQPVSGFSLGMKQRLALARTLIHKPRLLILDEPLNGLDPVGIREMRELFQRIVEERHCTILLSSHILTEIEKISDTVGFLVDGRVVQECSPAEIQVKSGLSLEDYFVRVTNGGEGNV